MRELELLSHIYRSNPKLPPDVTIPPGDDMGALSIGGASVLVTVDQLAEGVHFELSGTPIEKIARKAMTRNLSDVAAMAAKPVGAVAAASLPRGFGEAHARALFDAMHETANGYGCPLVGGDISIWDEKLIITVTVFAESEGIEPVLRSGARVGDTVFVTGRLGGSLAVLDDPPRYVHHLDFTPRVALARELAASSKTRPHAMIDLSDGLGLDLMRICELSGVSAEVRADQMPISPGAVKLAETSGRPVWQHAMSDGEDYELCFTAPGEAIPDQIDGVPITPIGIIAEPGSTPRVTVRLSDGQIADTSARGWEHHG